jgi:hypothetical protein
MGIIMMESGHTRLRLSLSPSAVYAFFLSPFLNFRYCNVFPEPAILAKLRLMRCTAGSLWQETRISKLALLLKCLKYLAVITGQFVSTENIYIDIEGGVANAEEQIRGKISREDWLQSIPKAAR